MDNLITWVKNHTQSIYIWIGRLTVLIAVGAILFILLRFLFSQAWFTIDPLQNVLLALILWYLMKINHKFISLESKISSQEEETDQEIIEQKYLEFDLSQNSSKPTKPNSKKLAKKQK